MSQLKLATAAASFPGTISEGILRSVGQSFNFSALDLLVQQKVNLQKYGVHILQGAILSKKTAVEPTEKKYRLYVFEKDKEPDEKFLKLCITQVDFVDKLLSLGVKIPAGSHLGHKLLFDPNISVERKMVLLHRLVNAGLTLQEVDRTGRPVLDSIMDRIRWDALSRLLVGLVSFMVNLGPQGHDALQKSQVLGMVIRYFFQCMSSQENMPLKMMSRFPMRIPRELWSVKLWYKWDYYTEYFTWRLLSKFLQVGYTPKDLIRLVIHKAMDDEKMNGYLLATHAKPYYIHKETPFPRKKNNPIYIKYRQDLKKPPSLSVLSAHSIRQELKKKVPGASALPLMNEFIKQTGPLPKEITSRITLERFTVVDNKSGPEPNMEDTFNLPWAEYKEKLASDLQLRAKFAAQEFVSEGEILDTDEEKSDDEDPNYIITLRRYKRPQPVSKSDLLKAIVRNFDRSVGLHVSDSEDEWEDVDSDDEDEEEGEGGYVTDYDSDNPELFDKYFEREMDDLFY